MVVSCSMSFSLLSCIVYQFGKRLPKCHISHHITSSHQESEISFSNSYISILLSSQILSLLCLTYSLAFSIAHYHMLLIVLNVYHYMLHLTCSVSCWLFHLLPSANQFTILSALCLLLNAETPCAWCWILPCAHYPIPCLLPSNPSGFWAFCLLHMLSVLLLSSIYNPAWTARF